MFFLILFLAVGGTYVAARSATNPVVLLVIALYVTLSYVLAPIVWILERSGLMGFIHRSWLFLGGIEHPREIGKTCEKINEDMNIFLGLGIVLFGILLIIVFMGAATILTMWILPFGIIATAFGAVRYIFTKDDHYLQKGLKYFTYGVGGILVGGFGIRVINLFTGLGLNCA